MNQEFLDFLFLQDANARYVVAGSILLGISAGALGCFTVLRKRALIGDAVAHAVLPGICIAFLFTGTKDPFILLAGALVSGWLATIVMDYLANHTRLSTDTGIALVLSVSFGLGILLLTMIQQSGMAGQSGLNTFLFGQAAAMLPSDVTVFGIISLAVLGIIVLLFKEFALLSFDPVFAQAIGLNTRLMEIAMTTLLVGAITVGIQAVGVVLMAALLITPAAAARYWTENLRTMVILAAVFGAASGWMGALVSYLLPSMPTGPWVVVAATALFALSLLFAPNRGMLARISRRNRVEKRIQTENLLKTLFMLEEETPGASSEATSFSFSQIQAKRLFSRNGFRRSVRLLERSRQLETISGQFRLTEAGRSEGRRISRLHRLWEVYLTEAVHLPADHVHADAEEMEHVITPELEDQLTRLLNRPKLDPHMSPIPYDNEPDRNR